MNAKLPPGTTEATTIEKHQQHKLSLLPTVSTIPTASSTSATLKISNFPMKKKRKFSAQKGVHTLRCQSDSNRHTNFTSAHDATSVSCEGMSEKSLDIRLRGDEITQEMRAILKAASATATASKTSQITASVAVANTTHDVGSCSNICLICRQQHGTKYCSQCYHRQYLLPLDTATAKAHCTTCSCSYTADDSKHCTCSCNCSHSCCQQRHQRHVNCCHYTPLPTTLTTRALNTCKGFYHQQKCVCTASSPPTTTMTAVKHLNESNSNKIDELSKSCINCCQRLPHSVQMTSSSATTSVVTIKKSLTATNITKQTSLDSCTNDNQILPIATAAASYFSCLLLNALKTFQLLIFFMQTTVLLPQQLLKTRRREQQQQQQRPPLTRLRFRSNSYVATSSTTSRKYHHHLHHQQQQHQTQQQQQVQQLPATWSRHFYSQQPNYSVLYIILIILSFLSLFLPSTQAQAPFALPPPLHTQQQHHQQQQVRLSRNETVCKSMDIRNTPDNFQQLRNCTVIEGFLLITLVNTNTCNSGICAQGEFTESFPLLTEVTEFVVLYRVFNLRSLSQIFPNLSIIRGRARFEGYALVVYANPHLEDLGLSKLLTISNGGVRIENNLSLCFVETIDWSQIVTNTTDVVKLKNRALIECPQCPGDIKINSQDGIPSDNDLVCKERLGRRHCWNSKSCQKFCPDRCRGNCIDENTCCNESCLGGCAPGNLSVCRSCRHYSIYNNSCTDECPLNYYSYLDRRCITAESCAAIGFKYENNRQEQLVAFNRSCTALCPENYNKINDTCQKCGDKCVKRCQGGLIDSVTLAKEFHGCTHIIESGLIISIKRGGKHLMKDLEFGLSSIQVIETYLKVHRTYGMFSLEFFKNLQLIRGSVLCEERFALYVLENNDLETIWRPNQIVRIEDGRVFFHFNPKLCYSTIEALRPMLKNHSTFDKNEVATDSNGSKGACNTEFLNTTVQSTAATVAFIEIVNPLNFEDERTFIGYQYFHIEDKYGNATKHSNRPCDDGWNADEPTKEIKHIYTHLQPYTQYAYYVKTMTISSEPRNAQSPIQYFKTKSAQPDLVKKIVAQSISSSEITIYWQPPKFAHGKLIRYRVRALLDRSTQKSESRNYCKDPLREAAKIETTAHQPVPEKPITNDCKCQKNKDGGYEEISDEKAHDVIYFENTVQDFIYVKQPNKTHKKNYKFPEHLDDSELPSGSNNIKTRRLRSDDNTFDSFLIRHMRATTDEDLKLPISTGNGTSSSTTTSTIIIAPTTQNSNNNTTNNDTRIYTDEWIEVNATTTEYTFHNLKHFSVYMLGVEACREPEIGANDKECSDEQTEFVRTNKKENVDQVLNLEVDLLTNTNTTRSSVRIRWEPPPHPNGVVVSYTIAYLSAALDSVEEKKCITEQDYQNLTNGYILTGLPTGNYSIRVQANSLAGEGVYSEPRYVFIPPTQISSTIIAIICIAVLIFIGLIAGVVYYLRKKILTQPSDLKIYPTINPYYISMQYIPDDWEVPRDRIIQLSALGQGSFGMVYEGILKNFNNSNEDTPCAIKTVNENATDRERANFLNEASVMKQFDTFHVVRLLGVCSRGQPALVIMELMKNGDLKSYLRAHRPDERDEFGVLSELPVQPPPLSRIYQMAIEIADGMAYLAAKKFVHRDLAARNCMVAADLTVKIGDFGMTRDIYETDYYRKGTKGLLPVRWMPPESLRDGVYSSASDVFSYGVVLWEMATLASQPYQGLSNDQVLRYVIDGGVMERPENCPDKLYRLMQKCWHHRPSARPSFMSIIRSLIDMADPHFREVSFFHSEEGQQASNKEVQESLHHTGDVFTDHDNDMDDVTTPLRVGEYNDYKLNMDNNSSVENHNESPIIIDDDHPNSPYSLGSAIIISSTPDGQSKNSFNLSQMSHNNPTLSSAPSTSAGLISSGGGGLSSQLHHPQTYPYQRHPHAPFQQHSRFPEQHQGDDAAYVQPDEEDDEITLGGNIAKSVDTDDRPYEIYDPSPNYREHAPYDAEDEEFDGPPSDRKLSSGQNLLPKQRSRQLLPTIMPMSSSMPDDVISSVPMSSSLQPSNASAASSNASSTATGGASVGGVGGVSSGMGSKYPSLKKAVADTVHSVGHSLAPQWRNINRLFNHKRSGSNASHKSTSSNPTSNSNSNLSQAGAGSGIGRGQSISGSNLGTIESGGSGSTGSYVPIAPRFFTAHTSDNPNYKLLDDTANVSGISVEDSNATNSKTSTAVAPSTKTKSKSSGFSSSTNPTYQLLNESLNTTASPTKPTTASAAFTTSENPNYELMQAPSTLTTSDNPNYVMMNDPASQDTLRPVRGTFSALPLANLSENPNYQIMGPPAVPAIGSNVYSTPSATAALRRGPSAERHSVGGNSHSSRSTSASASASSSNDEDVGVTDTTAEGIEMERMPISRRHQHGSNRGGNGDSSASRSRTQSQARTAESVTAPTIQPITTSNKLKEKWLREQQQLPKLPPPNGFIGREG